MNVSDIAAVCRRLASAVVRLQDGRRHESSAGTQDVSARQVNFRYVPEPVSSRSKAYLVDLEKIESAKFARRLW
jgi:hypothetical protein